MLIEMPYGLVTVDTADEAVRFIKNHCNNCPYNTGFNSCSGAQAALCDDAVNQVVQRFKIAKNNT